jgi:hypothetical protein
MPIREPIFLDRTSRRIPSTGFTELQVMYEISRQASAAPDAGTATDVIAALVLRSPGVVRLSIDWEADPPESWGPAAHRGPLGSAVAPIVIDAVKLGTLSLSFRLNHVDLESPSRFALFVAQQISRVHELSVLTAQKLALERQIAADRQEVASRKAFHRARGMVARSRRVSEVDAGALLRKFAAQTGRTVRELSEELIARDRAVDRFSAPELDRRTA